MADHSQEIAELTARAKVLQAKYEKRYDDLQPLDAHRHELSLELAAAKAAVAEADKQVQNTLDRAMSEDKAAQQSEAAARAAELKGDKFEAEQSRQYATQERNDAERWQHDAQVARQHADEYRAKVTQLTEEHAAADKSFGDLYWQLDQANSGINRLEYVAQYLGQLDTHTNAAERYTQLAADDRAKGNAKDAKAHDAEAAKEAAAAAKLQKQVDVQRSYFDEAEKSFGVLDAQPVADATPATTPDAPATADAADAASSDVAPASTADAFLDEEAPGKVATTTDADGSGTTSLDDDTDTGTAAAAPAAAAAGDLQAPDLLEGINSPTSADDAGTAATVTPTDGVSMDEAPSAPAVDVGLTEVETNLTAPVDVGAVDDAGIGQPEPQELAAADEGGNEMADSAAEPVDTFDS